MELSHPRGGPLAPAGPQLTCQTGVSLHGSAGRPSNPLTHEHKEMSVFVLYRGFVVVLLQQHCGNRADTGRICEVHQRSSHP